eukprot:SM000037S13541  [mRNA]  locus=s37:534342:540282:+ [translate_table: standard]
MGSRLRDMIRAVRACKTAAEERAVIAKECAALRAAFRDADAGAAGGGAAADHRHRNVAKLMFVHMLGYPTHFGQMECLKLVAGGGFPEKRVGYLGLMLLLDERQEVLMLVTNSLKNDLNNHSNQYIVGLALCALGNIGSAEMSRDLAPEIERLLSSNNSYIRKKAALCSVRLVRKVPELVENLVGPASGLLIDKHHGVLISGVKLVTELCLVSATALDLFRRQTPALVRILKNLVISGYAPEYDVGGVTDPFLQILILRLLRLLGRNDPDASDIMSDVLAQASLGNCHYGQVATNTESNKNAGNAILYECVQTIMAVEAIGGLRVLAINILGRFLANRDNNIRYVALNMLVKVVAVDTQAVQRHRNTILECIKDSDVSIQRRALELVYALVNENNVKASTKELLEYLKISAPEFKPDLTAKICLLVQRFSPNKRWHLDILIKVMVEAGQYVGEDFVRSLIVLIMNAPELHGYTVRLVYRAFQSWQGQESLAQLTVWCIGEYGELLVKPTDELEGEEVMTVTEADATDVLESVLADQRSSPAARAYALVALLKLSSRFPSCSGRVKDLIEQHRSSLQLELQQRAVEFSTILARHSKLRTALMEKMPALDEATYLTKQQVETGLAVDVTKADSQTRSNVQPNGIKTPVQPMLADLLDFSVDDGAASQPSSSSQAQNGLLDMLGAPPTISSGTSGVDTLLDLLSLGDIPSNVPTSSAASASTISDPFNLLLGTSSPAETSSSPLPPTPVDSFGSLHIQSPVASAPAIPSIVAFQSAKLKIVFDLRKDNSNAQVTHVHATFFNNTSDPLDEFVFQAAVPKFMQLRLEPASASMLPANSGSVTQDMVVTNSLHGQKALVMKLRIAYKALGQDVLEQGQVSNFPQHL